jgi:uncharacterized protein YkwD
MARRWIAAFVAALGIVLAAPVGAQARTACPAELSAPTAANSAQVSDAIFCITNQIRSSYGLAPFRRDARLDAAARLHSQDMAARNFFAHTTPEGLTPDDRAAAQGYPSGVGENIAYGYATARAVMIGWMASTGHCQNILGAARDIGVGTAPSARGGYYTQDFGDYDFGASGATAGGCPYTIDLDALVTPDVASPPLTAALAATTAAQKPALPSATADAPAGLVLGGLGLSSARLRVGGPAGVVSYTLSAPARVTFGVERRAAGRRAAGRCAARAPSNRGAPPCTRYTTLRGTLTDDGAQGANTFEFRGRLRGRRLAPGRYRLRVAAADDAGNHAPLQRVAFRVTGR